MLRARRTSVADPAFLSETDIRAVALGKKSPLPIVSKVRVLLPLGVWMTVLDILISGALHELCDAQPAMPECWECGVAGAGNSASHTAHFAKPMVEKSLDAFSTGALVLTDIRTFYDKIDVGRAIMDASACGLPPHTAAAALRHQLLPRISLHAADVCVGQLSRRATGALTGSRTAGALGRVVVRALAEHLSAARRASMRSLFGSSPMLLATYVDNLILVGVDASGAEATYAAASAYLGVPGASSYRRMRPRLWFHEGRRSFRRTRAARREPGF